MTRSPSVDALVDQSLEHGRSLLREGRLREADEAFQEALGHASRTRSPVEQARVAQRAGSFAWRASQPLLAVRWFERAAVLAPDDPEPRHERGLAHLELGQVGLAAQSQGEALALDPGHRGALAQRAAALEALGDDAEAAFLLQRLLDQIGPQPALSARILGLEAAAARCAAARLLGGPARLLLASPLVKAAFAHVPKVVTGPVRRIDQEEVEGAVSEGPGRARLTLRSTSAELRAGLTETGLRDLTLLFDDMQASLQRSDTSYGGTIRDELGRTVPLDEFTAAATVFLSHCGGVEPQRARRLLDWLLTAQAGRGPHPWAGIRVTWQIEEGPTGRRYGLGASLP